MGNGHPYAAYAERPEAYFDAEVSSPDGTKQAGNYIRHYSTMTPNANTPIVATECGYNYNGEFPNYAVTERVAARYIPRLQLEMFNRGFKHTWLYELFDEGSNEFGLIKIVRPSDPTSAPPRVNKRAAFYSVKHMMQLIRDDAGTSNLLGSLSLTAKLAGTNRSIVITDDQNPNTNEPIHTTLLRKKDGRYYLLIWQTAESYKTEFPTTQKEADPANNITVPPISIDLTINNMMHKGTLCDPVIDTVGGNATTNGLWRLRKLETSAPNVGIKPTVRFDVTDYPRILELTSKAP